MNVSAQRFCGTPKKMNNFFAANPEAKANQEALRNFFDH